MNEQTSVILGKVKITPKGEYNAEIQYAFLDIVSDNGSSYLAKKPSINVPVTNTEYWQLIAQKGSTGTAAGFGEPTAEVEHLTPDEEPTVEVTSSGTDIAKIFHFVFGIPRGQKGDTGNGIASIEKTGSVGKVDTYTITYTDETTATFTVTNGTDGAAAGFGTVEIEVDSAIGTPWAEIQTSGPDTAKVFKLKFHNLKGVKGDDGVSPEVIITEIEGGHTVTITDAAHPDGQTFNVLDGEDGASDAGEVTYDPTETYADGSIGKALQTEVARATEAENGKISKSAQREKTEDMLQPVGIDADGKLWAKGGGTAEDITYDAAETYSDGTVGAALTAQSGKIAQLQTTKADKGVVDRHTTEIQFLMDAQKGVTAEIVEDNTEAYSKAVPAYTGATAKLVDIKKVGGKSIVANQIITNGNFATTDNWTGSMYATKSVADGVMTVGTSTSSNRDFSVTQNVNCVKGHRYFVHGHFVALIATSSDRYPMSAKLAGATIFSKGVTAGEIIEINTIVSVDSDITNNTIILSHYYGAGVPVGSLFSVSDLYVIDVTNLPADITADSPEIQALVKYYKENHLGLPFNEIISADYDVVQSWSKNLLNDSAANKFSAWLGNNSDVWRYTNDGSKTYLVKCKPNTDYSLSVSSDVVGASILRSAYLKATDEQVANLTKTGTTGSKVIQAYGYRAASDIHEGYTFTTPSNATYIVVQISAQSVGKTIVEESSSVTSFSPYGVMDFMSIPQGLRTDYPLRSAGDVYDYLLFKQENGVPKVEHHRKLGIVDFGDKTWIKDSTFDGQFYTPLSDAVAPASATEKAKLICDKYENTIRSMQRTDNPLDKSICLTVSKNIYICDSSLAGKTVNEVKEILTGTKLIYACETETVTDVTSYFEGGVNTLLRIEDGGSVTFKQTDTEFPVPNTEDFYYDLNEEASA